MCISFCVINFRNIYILYIATPMQRLDVTRLKCTTRLDKNDVTYFTSSPYDYKLKYSIPASIKIDWDIIMYSDETGISFVKVDIHKCMVTIADFEDIKGKTINIIPYTKLLNKKKEEELSNFVEIEDSEKCWKDTISYWGVNSAMSLQITEVKIDADNKTINFKIN